MAFTSVVVGNLGLVFVNRSRHAPLSAALRGNNTALWWLTGGALAALGLVLVLAPLREIFRFGTLGLAQLAWCVVSGLTGLAVYELYKAGKVRYATHCNASCTRHG